MEVEKTVTEEKKVEEREVPETLLKAKKRRDALKMRNEKRLKRQKTNDLEKRKIMFKSAESYVKEYRMMEREIADQRRIAKGRKGFFVEPEAKLLFVIRIRGINGVPPKPRKILQLLRLGQVHNGVFVRVNKATMNMLNLVQSYVTFGYPSLKSVREMIYKRGYSSFRNQRIPLTDNSVIEKCLGKYKIICIEDLIHEIFTVGPHFKEANTFLWPFKLNSPKGGFKSIVRPFTDGGDAGQRENHINDLIHKMN